MRLVLEYTYAAPASQVEWCILLWQQMFPNASRFLQRWGVDELIGDNLVEHDEANTWSGGPGLNLISKIDAKKVSKSSGFPWFEQMKLWLTYG